MAQVIPDLTGVVLAGGLSSRFGSGKAAAPWRDRTLVEAVTAVLLEAGMRVVVVAKGRDRRLLEGPRVRVVADVRKEVHPLVGLYSGLLACPTGWAFVAACDMPFLKVPLIRRLAAARAGWEAVLPVWRGRPEPLCGLYARSCLPALEAVLTPGPGGSVLDFARGLRVRWFDEKEVAAADPEGSSFVDLDDPAAYREALHAVLA